MITHAHNGFIATTPAVVARFAVAPLTAVIGFWCLAARFVAHQFGHFRLGHRCRFDDCHGRNSFGLPFGGDSVTRRTAATIRAFPTRAALGTFTAHGARRTRGVGRIFMPLGRIDARQRLLQQMLDSGQIFFV
jgi:hypothetical protein